MQSTYRGIKGEEEREREGGEKGREKCNHRGKSCEAALGCGKCLCPTKRTMRCVCLCVCGRMHIHMCVCECVCVCGKRALQKVV